MLLLLMIVRLTIIGGGVAFTVDRVRLAPAGRRRSCASQVAAPPTSVQAFRSAVSGRAQAPVRAASHDVNAVTTTEEVTRAALMPMLKAIGVCSTWLDRIASAAAMESTPTAPARNPASPYSRMTRVST